MKKEPLNVVRPKPYDKKYPQHAKGDSLPEGVSHYAKAGDVDGMYPRNEAKQRAPKGHDRI